MGGMTLLAVLVFVLVWVALARALGPRWSRRNLQAQFRATMEPGGPFVKCNVRFVPDEAHTPCLAKATPAGLYLVSPAEALARRNWSVEAGGLPCLTEPVLIPWSLLTYHPAKFPLWGWLRFDIPSAKVVFFVRRKVATELLRQAGQPLP